MGPWEFWTFGPESHGLKRIIWRTGRSCLLFWKALALPFLPFPSTLRGRGADKQYQAGRATVRTTDQGCEQQPQNWCLEDSPKKVVDECMLVKEVAASTTRRPRLEILTSSYFPTPSLSSATADDQFLFRCSWVILPFGWGGCYGLNQVFWSLLKRVQQIITATQISLRTFKMISFRYFFNSVLNFLLFCSLPDTCFVAETDLAFATQAKLALILPFPCLRLPKGQG